jgi:hypothetical protein
VRRQRKRRRDVDGNEGVDSGRGAEVVTSEGVSLTGMRLRRRRRTSGVWVEVDASLTVPAQRWTFQGRFDQRSVNGGKRKSACSLIVTRDSMLTTRQGVEMS